MASGGKREGAGRKYGSKSRPTIFEFWDNGDIATFFDHLKEKYKTDSRIAVFVGEHLMGKPQQTVALTGADGAPLFDGETKAKTDRAVGEILGQGDSQ